MSRIFIVLLLLLSCAGFCFSQSRDTSPDQWKKYSVPDKNVTVSLPALPVYIADTSRNCMGQRTDRYGIYSYPAAYVLSVTYKEKPYKYCPLPEEFSDKNFNLRLEELSGFEKMRAGEKENRNGLAALKFHKDIEIIQIYNDPVNNRWFELRTVGGDESKPEVSAFLASLSIEKTTTGIDIGEGWDGIKNIPQPPVEIKTTSGGDKSGSGVSGSSGAGSSVGNGAGSGAGVGGSGDSEAPGAAANSSPGSVPENIPGSRGTIMVMKPRPTYTEEARKNQVAGIVRLKVVFNANGSIGSITVVSGLSHGMTEQAIAAARKLVFVPAQKGEVSYSVTKVVEYNFSVF